MDEVLVLKSQSQIVTVTVTPTKSIQQLDKIILQQHVEHYYPVPTLNFKSGTRHIIQSRYVELLINDDLLIKTTDRRMMMIPTHTHRCRWYNQSQLSRFAA